MLVIIITIAILAVSGFIFTKFLSKGDKQQQSKQNSENQKDQQKPQQKQQISLKQLQKQVKNKKEKKKKIVHKHIEHPLYLNSAFNFEDDITDFDYAGNFIAIASKDKTFKLFDILTIKEESLKYFQMTFQYDYPTAICISRDMQYVAVAMKNEQTIKVYSFDKDNENRKKVFQIKQEFSTKIHDEPIKKLFINEENRFIVSFAEDKDTNIKIWDLHTKDLIHTIHSQLAQHLHCSFSKNMILPTGWVSDMKVYMMVQDKHNKSFQKIQKILSLPHNKTISYSNISDNEERIFTFSKDICLKIWNCKVDWNFQEDPKLLKEYHEQELKSLFKDYQINHISAHATYNEQTKKWLYVLASNRVIVCLDNKFNEIERMENIVSDECNIDDVRIVTVKNASVLLAMSQFEQRVSIFKINSLLK